MAIDVVLSQRIVTDNLTIINIDYCEDMICFLPHQ